MKTASEVINALGGTVKVAKICGISPEAVTQWRGKPVSQNLSYEEGIPKAWRLFFETKYKKIFKDS